MVVVLAVGTAMLWTVQKILTSHQHNNQHHVVAMSAFSAAGMDSPLLSKLMRSASSQVVHPKDLSAYLALNELHHQRSRWHREQQRLKEREKKRREQQQRELQGQEEEKQQGQQDERKPD